MKKKSVAVFLVAATIIAGGAIGVTGCAATETEQQVQVTEEKEGSEIAEEEKKRNLYSDIL